MKYILRRARLGRGSTNAISALTNGRFTVTLDPNSIPEGSDVIRWGCTATIPSRTGTLLNRSSAIHKVNNKTLFRQTMLDALVRVPPTFTNRQELRAAMNGRDRFIMRPRFHAQGRKIVVITRPEEINAAIVTCGDGWYASSFIPKDREFRIYVVHGRVVAVAEKFVEDTDKIAWNKALGGSFRNVLFGAWPLEACKEAIKAFNVSDLDFGGVDVIQVSDNAGTGTACYVLEINSAPSLTSQYRQECFAKAFVFENEVPPVDLPNVRGWRRLVHPAISEEFRA